MSHGHHHLSLSKVNSASDGVIWSFCQGVSCVCASRPPPTWGVARVMFYINADRLLQGFQVFPIYEPSFRDAFVLDLPCLATFCLP